MSVQDFPNPGFLVSAGKLRERLGAVTLLDLRPAEDFAVGHIEGSRHVDIYGISLMDTAEAPLAAFLGIFQVLFGARGVRLDRPVVVYDHESGERAARAVWMLAVLGHPDVKILDGGAQAWYAAGHSLVQLRGAPAPVDPAKAPPTPPPFKAALNLDFLATRFDVHAAIGDPDAVILDVDNGAEAFTTAFNGRLYSDSGVARAHAALQPGGLLAVWSAVAEPAFVERMRRVGFTVTTERARLHAGGTRSRGRGQAHLIVGRR